ncbi:MAG TPA: crosslink repair DNA glycosylase YcaQ family protein, partial [Caulobacter sp.]|nr:crosslink repair DNA glycosylase YcaQ family protein [Caulobacter sp.]
MGSTAKTLDRRALNRALLARQHLSRRADISVAEALERLIALQAQAAQAAYFALWTRLEGFAPQQLSDRLEDFSLVRGTLMRGTLHLATAKDFAAIRPLIQRGLDRFLTEGGVHGRALAGLDPLEVAKAARDLLR